MFCGFCDQPCDDTYGIHTHIIQAYGQRGESIQSTFFCDDACVCASIRKSQHKNMMDIIQLSKALSPTKVKDSKEASTYFLTIRSLAKYFKACFERKPKEELEILRSQVKRMFAEAFCYEELIDSFSRWNAGFLGDDLLEAFSK